MPPAREADGAAPTVVRSTPTTPAPTAKVETPETKATAPAAKEAAPEPGRWEIRVVQDELGRLIEARELTHPQGDTGWHRHAAEAADRWERLQEAALKLDLPRGFLPEDDLSLLDRPRLEALKDLWSRNLEQFRTEAARREGGSGSRRIREAEAKLERIAKVLKAPQVDLADRFDKLPNKPKIAPEFLTWMNGESTEAQNARINLRQQQLLKKTLAIDDSDLGARQELEKLRGENSVNTFRDRLVQVRSRLAADRFDGFSPGPEFTPNPSPGNSVKPGSAPNSPDRSALIKELFANRFKAPKLAIDSEALLNYQWEQLKSIGDPRIRAVLLPDGHEQSVLRWMVSQMTKDDLAAAKLLAVQASEYEKKLLAMALNDTERRSESYDRTIIAREIRAIDEEYAYREAHGDQPSAPAVDPAVLDGPTRQLLTAHATAKVEDLEKTPEGKQMLLAAENRYILRTEQPVPEVVASRNRHHMDGIENEVKALAEATENYQKLRDQYSRRGFSGTLEEAKKIDESFAKMRGELESQATRIRVALNDTGSVDVGKSTELWQRVEQGDGGYPGTAGEVPSRGHDGRESSAHDQHPHRWRGRRLAETPGRDAADGPDVPRGTEPAPAGRERNRARRAASRRAGQAASGRAGQAASGRAGQAASGRAGQAASGRPAGAHDRRARRQRAGPAVAGVAHRLQWRGAGPQEVER